MNMLLEAAIKYRGYGLSIVPVSVNKSPIEEWRRFQQEIMTEKELVTTFSKDGVRGIAVVCGIGSGNFEAIDIDARNDLSGTLMYEYVAALQDTDPALHDRLILASTRNKGYHFYYRSDTVGRDTVLAKRETTADERIIHPKNKTKVLIETRGNGGIIVVPPSQGYQFLQCNLSMIPLIEPAKRQLLFDIGRAFNLVRAPAEVLTKPGARIYTNDGSPFLHYDCMSDHLTIRELLERHDWIFVETVLPRSFYKRPGSTEQRTSGHFHHDLKLFKVFTTNSDFIAHKPYRPHAVFGILECAGNFTEAARRLVRLGYGKPYKRA